MTDVLQEKAILMWAAIRENGSDSIEPELLALFSDPKVAQFIEWLRESDEEGEEEDDDEEDDNEEDEDDDE